ncbi:class I SAM-dependent methyltransferase [Paenibacillus sp. FSL R7-0331]|uniref:class I SAM-dependent methyltransferase n=1 Tax=Paenibacillus sp. FSL R7-0331 TaxID=1536773 RepID=UPI0004F631BA|nr:class I SAM-dependent methyltransferase [Paenibacillus sp. FSL R7-0331]AIQ53950.1 methyltransferase type 11 [Paenibacillus sp. FSL R7-0331]
MRYNWINAEEFSFNSFLLLDRWIIEMICRDYREWTEYEQSLGAALAYNPAVAWYFVQRSPESKAYVEQIIAAAAKGLSAEEVRRAEVFVLQAMETSVVYAYPEIMNRNCNYIYDWDKKHLLDLADFRDALVLDVGSGTGRLAFAAAEQARRVYASEPTDRLREYIRDKIKRENVSNVKVLDGTADSLPYEDNTFDIVMSGHVVGDHYDLELAELTRVVKNGGVIIDCIGDDDHKRKPDDELLRRGFEVFYHVSKSGGDIYTYRKKITK